MAGSPKCIAQFALGSSNIVFVTCPSSKRWTLSFIHVHNTDTVARVVTLNHVLNGASPGVLNEIMPASSLPNGDFAEFFGGAVLVAGDTIQGLCDVTGKVGVAIYGIEESV